MNASGGSGFGPSPSPPEPFYKDFRVPEPEVFESGQARARPEPEEKARGYPRVSESHVLQSSLHSKMLRCEKIS